MSLQRKRLGIIACLAAPLLALSVSSAHAQGALAREANSFQTFQCDSGASLQTQILSARDGATIFPGGTCEGPFVVSERDVNFRGFGSSRSMLTAAPGSDCVLTIRFADVKLSRIDIDASGADHGICVGPGASLFLLEDVEIRNAGDIGVFLFGGASAEINESRINDNNGIGLGVSSGAHASVLSTEVRNNGLHGIDVNGSSSAELAANELTGNGGAGLRVDVNSAVNFNEPFFAGDPNFGEIAGNLGGGVFCGLSGAVIVGTKQIFGGNPTGNVNAEEGCHVVNPLMDGEFPPTTTAPLLP